MKDTVLKKEARDINAMKGPLSTKMSIKEVSQLKEKIDRAVEEFKQQNNTKEKVANIQENNKNRSLFSEATKEKYAGEER